MFWIIDNTRVVYPLILMLLIVECFSALQILIESKTRCLSIILLVRCVPRLHHSMWINESCNIKRGHFWFRSDLANFWHNGDFGGMYSSVIRWPRISLNKLNINLQRWKALELNSMRLLGKPTSIKFVYLAYLCYKINNLLCTKGRIKEKVVRFCHVLYSTNFNSFSRKWQHQYTFTY